MPRVLPGSTAPGRPAVLAAALAVVLAASAAAPAVAAPSPSGPSPGPASGPSATPLPAVHLPLPGATVPQAAVTVLPALSGVAPLPTAAGVTAALGKLLARPALGTSVSVDVTDVTTGAELLSRTPTRAVVPASATKLLTGAAALTALGPQASLPTRTVQGATPGEIVLVGGGDVMLAPGAGDPDAVMGHAGLADLADRTVAALRGRATGPAGGQPSASVSGQPSASASGQGAGPVTLRLDDTLFTGPAVNPAWPGDVGGGFVAPVMPLEVTVGVTRPGTPPRPGQPAARLADPALSAARQFATLLAARGVAVTGPVTRAAAPAGATVLGEVRSASIADIVEHDLTDSDNTTAEVLARLVAVAGKRPATFAGGGEAVLQRVAALGVPITGARLSGGSGLDPHTVVGVRTIVRVLALAADRTRPQLRSLLTGLPVAGASGTLVDRFAGTALAPGVGVVRAKTGTLTGVSALAGTVVDAEGRQLAFAVVADAVPATEPARVALDAVAVALAGCGCR